MKYFNPSYWFKLWVLSAPLFNDKTQGINAKSIDNNQKIKNWTSKNTNLQSISQEISYTNSTTNTNYQPYNLNKVINQNIDSLYKIELETSTHKHRHEKSKKNKRETNAGSMIEFEGHFLGVDGKVLISLKPELWEEISFLYRDNNKEDFSKKLKNLMFEVPLWKDWRVENVPEDVKKIGKVIYDNFSIINNKFRNSSRRERIMIIIEKNKDFWTSNYSFAYKETNIRTDDSHYYPNKYIPDLVSDFKTCIDPVDNTNDETILKAIKSKNPSVDISQVYVKEKTINGKLDIGVKSDSNKYNINSSASCPNLQVKLDLRNVIKNTHLGALNDNNDDTIINAVKSKNNLADLNYIIRNKDNNKAEFVIIIDNDYYWKWSWTDIYYTVKLDLSSDFKTCIDPVDNTNDETILKAIKSKNPNLDTSQVYVKDKIINGRLNIGVKPNSWKYNTKSPLLGCDNLKIKPETTTSISSSQNQQGLVSKSGYKLEELTNQKYNTDFQQAQINYQNNQNLNDYTNAQQRFVQAQNDYILHIQQGQPLSSSNQHNNRYITTPAITLMENDEQGIYSSGISDVIRVLVDNDIIREFNHGSSLNTMYYLNEDSSYQYLIIPIVVIQDNEQQNTAQIIELVLRRNDLYLDGFAINNSYYYFHDATIRTINNMNRNIDLTFDATYGSLRSGSDTARISWNNIFQAFNDVINWDRNGGIIAGRNTAILRNNLSLIILAISESMRFETVRRNISNTNTERRSWNFYHDIIRNWNRYTNNIIQNFRTNGNLVNLGNIALLGGIHILLGRVRLNEGMQNINSIVRSCFNNEYNHNQNLNRINSNNNLYCINIEPKKFFWTGFEYQNQIMYFVQENSIFRKGLIYTCELGKVNPIDNFNRLEFLGDLNSDYWGVRTKWGSLIYDGQTKNYKPEHTYNLKYYMEQLYSRNNKFHDLIKNVKVNANISPEEAEQHAPNILQQIVDHGVLGIAAMNGKQSFGLTWYWENENYYVQVIFFQYLKWWASGSSLESWLKYGSGIRFYNDYSDRTKRSIFSDYTNITEKDTKKFQEKNELRSTTKWFKNITNFINQEEHLPSITNNTNYIANNITNL